MKLKAQVQYISTTIRSYRELIFKIIWILSTGTNLITAANFCLQGRFAVVGTYDGRCIFYETEVRLPVLHGTIVVVQYDLKSVYL